MVDVRPDLLQQNGYLHGGLLAYAADNAVTFAAGSVLGPAVLTSGVSIDYLAPAVGHSLRAEAKVVHAGSRRAVVRCDLVMSDGIGRDTLCAAAQGRVRTVRSQDRA